ncbi:hypothetical protein CC2G_003726 [Coprinopsis cinerea AmutBmut pab1-1]|nr:hypothetical protein CC2G_003726 [Coprinopsis cinerea AmutBmut pab1-1]
MWYWETRKHFSAIGAQTDFRGLVPRSGDWKPDTHGPCHCGSAIRLHNGAYAMQTMLYCEDLRKEVQGTGHPSSRDGVKRINSLNGFNVLPPNRLPIAVLLIPISIRLKLAS